MRSRGPSIRRTPPGRGFGGFGQVRIDPPIPPVDPGPGGGGVGNLFNSSWETGGVGCGLAVLMDGTVWPGPPRNTLWDDSGGTDCTGRGGLPLTEVTTDQAVAAYGNKSLRIWQAPGNVNGTDFRVVKNFTQVTSGYFFMRWYIRWGSNFRFGNGDSKMVIQGPTDSQQFMYWNTRNTPGSNDSTRMTAYHDHIGSIWCDNRPSMAMTRNNWYCIETRQRIGVNGGLAARINTIPCVFTIDGGIDRDIDNHLVDPIGMHKMDSTYNDGAGITQFMDMYWDAFASSFSSNPNGWIGM